MMNRAVSFCSQIMIPARARAFTMKLALSVLLFFLASSPGSVAANVADEPLDDERQLITSPTLGNKKVLMIRIKTVDGLMSKKSKTELEDEFFGNGNSSHVSPASQFKACSYGKFTLNPFSGNINGRRITGGVYETTIDLPHDGTRGATNRMIPETTRVLNSQLGPSWRIDNGIDYVVYCMPKQTVSHAIVRLKLAVMSQPLCGSAYTLMHEIGHVSIWFLSVVITCSGPQSHIFCLHLIKSVVEAASCQRRAWRISRCHWNDGEKRTSNPGVPGRCALLQRTTQLEARVVCRSPHQSC